MDYSNVESVRALQRDFVLQEGFVNLRCQLSPGCPAEIQPFRKPPLKWTETRPTLEDVFIQLIHDIEAGKARAA